MPTQQNLYRWEKVALAGFLVLAVSFGIIVEIRSSFLSVRRTDFGVYARAGWSVLEGQSLYETPDERGWHFCYPPVSSLLFVPFADAPPEQSPTHMLPFAISVGVWYLLSVVGVWFAVHQLVSVLEESHSPPTECGSRIWWLSRMIPIYVVIAPLGGSLSRGQVTPLLLFLLAGMFAAGVRQQKLRSGFWLTAAICLKIIPAFLLVYPCWRRDRRVLLGGLAGLLIGVGIVPSLVWGISGGIHQHQEFLDHLVNPAVLRQGRMTHQAELIGITSTDHQSFEAILHNYQHWGKSERPLHATPEVRYAHLLIGGSLLLVLLLAYGWKKQEDPLRDLLLFGSLVLLMVLMSPVSHLHYFVLALPLVAGLSFASARRRNTAFPHPSMLLLFGVVALMFALPSIPFWEGRREAGLPMWASILLGIAAVRELRHKQSEVKESPEAIPDSVRLAA